MSRDVVLDLASVGATDLPRVGGKAVGLAALLGAGATVPPGFVVTTDAYRYAVGAASSAPQVLAAPVPEDLAEAVRTAYRDLGGGPVAVRSSATAEDLPGATFAGQQDTLLDVEGDEAVLGAVRRCWASLWSERAVDYRERLAIDPASVAMAVVVQRMVPAEAAGVLFTADPVSGRRDRVVVDAARGLGEAVVSGSVTPEHLVVGEDGEVLERRPGGDGGPVLTDAQVAELATTGRAVAAHLGRPQDVEWALDDGRFVLLQTRPMTALPPAPVSLSRIQRTTGPVLLELLPRRPLPLELTAWIRPVMGRHVEGIVAEGAGLHVRFADVLLADDAVVREFVPPAPRPTVRTPARVVRSLVRGLRGRPEAWARDPRLAGYRTAVEALDALDPTELTWEELVAVPRRAAGLVDVMTALRAGHLPAAFVAIGRLRLACVLTGRGGLFADLLLGAPTRTRAANDELAALARGAQEVPGLPELLERADPVTMAEVRALPGADGWGERLRHFLATYGHRETTSLLLLRDPTWGAAPSTVLGLVRALLADRDRPQDAARSGPPALTAAGALGRAAERAAAGVALREDTHFELTRTMPAVRRALLEAGRRLAATGEVDGPDDVWFLTLDELTARGDLRGAVTRRRAAYQELAGSPLIATTTLYPRPPTSAEVLAVGTPAGGGRATGPVRVLAGPAEFGRLRPGEVLVCASTNPGWTPLFQRAAAVVVDHGGMASHAAIVAREYGIPAVMGTGSGTLSLVEGARVVVDGDRGEVRAAPPEHL
ncbi:PEP/pyruvate-binding domain-containing protein [Ornithinimicrobium sp. W1665]|uniref:PEP/pyruvate-binding domain-containing protein n=1 Tax=Ornithinimicrobium sp. W1665 TaxID=3416666 RepID=UPI003CE9465E